MAARKKKVEEQEPPTRNVVVETIIWEGIEIEVSYEADWLGCNAKYGHQNSHLEVRSKVPIPVTETGYRSAFLAAGTVEEHGGPAKYAMLWIEGSAKSQAWREYKKAQAQPKQLDLFS